MCVCVFSEVSKRLQREFIKEMGVDPRAADNVAAGFAKLAVLSCLLRHPFRKCRTYRNMKPMFEFEIVIIFPGGKPDEAAVLDALFQAGLDDTIVGTGRPDRIAVGFTRDGPNLEQVLTDAVKHVIAAFPPDTAQVVGLAVLDDVKGKAETIRRVRTIAAQKATAGASAACSQDFLYGPDGLP